MEVRTEIVFEPSKIPAADAERLARGTLSAVKRFLEEPGGREFLDAKIKELREKGVDI